MGIFSWLRRNNENSEQQTKKRYVFSAEDREIAAELRAKRREIELRHLDNSAKLEELRMKKIELELQREIEDMKDDDIEDIDDSDSAEAAMIKAFAPIIAQIVSKNQNSVPPVTPAEPQPQHSVTEAQNIPDDVLKDIWKNTPSAAKAFAKGLSDDSLKLAISKQLPTANSSSILKAIAIIRAET